MHCKRNSKGLSVAQISNLLRDQRCASSTLSFRSRWKEQPGRRRHEPCGIRQPERGGEADSPCGDQFVAPAQGMRRTVELLNAVERATGWERLDREVGSDPAAVWPGAGCIKMVAWPVLLRLRRAMRRIEWHAADAAVAGTFAGCAIITVLVLFVPFHSIPFHSIPFSWAFVGPVSSDRTAGNHLVICSLEQGGGVRLPVPSVKCIQLSRLSLAVTEDRSGRK